MDMQTGKITMQERDGKPVPKTEGSMELSEYEAQALAGVPEHARPFRLGWIRALYSQFGTKKIKLSTFEKIRLKIFFQAGYNWAVITKAKDISADSL